MGSPVSQVAQPISQQSPQQGGKTGGLGNFALNAFKHQQDLRSNPASVVVPDATSSQTQQIDPTTTGVYNQPSNGQNFNQRLGKGGSVTTPGQGGQPKMGQPNNYPNTVGQWDNASIQPQQPQMRGGKGKG